MRLLPLVPTSGLRLFLLLSGLLLCLSANAQSLTFNCSFDPPTIQNAAGATRVSVPDCAPLQIVGAPVLPFRTLRLLLPPDSKFTGIEARVVTQPTSSTVIERVEHGRLPRTPGLPVSDETLSAEGPDPDIYLSDGAYPQERAELLSVQRLGGYDVAVVRVYPIQYRPLNGEITFAPSLEVKMIAEPGTAAAPARLRLRSATRQTQREQVSAFVSNPEMLKMYRPPRAPELLGDSPTYDYLLITKSNLVSSFQPLVELKTTDGLSVKVETVESISLSQTGRDTQEKIRNYIKYAYQTWDISYVLLGGDISVVPCRYAYVNMGSLVPNPTLPTDLYYACLDGSWNSDGDSNWGEPEDGEGGTDVDLLAEVYVGRAPVETPSEVGIFVEKTVRYATQRHANVANVLLLAEFLDNTPTGPAQGGDMFDPLVPLLRDYQATWLDDRFTVPEWRKQDALSAMNESPHLVLLNGHGWNDVLIGLQKPFVRSIETPDIVSLTNQWPFLAYSVGCNVGQFDNDRFSPDSIGEELVKQHSRGAFAAVFNSRLGWYDDQDEAKYSGEFQARFFAHLLSGGQTNFGIANQLSKHDLASRVEKSGIMTYRWCYYEITLFGDPHLAWQAPQPAMAVTSHGTPHSWLASYGWTNDFEAADLADADNDRVPAWQEYVAGTIPVDGTSVLRISSVSSSGASLRLEWPSVANRRYSIWTAPEPSMSNSVLVTNSLPAAPPVNSFIVSQPPGSRSFFRVGVEMVP